MLAQLSRRSLALLAVPAVVAGIALAVPASASPGVATHSAYGYGRNLNNTLCEYNSFDLDQNGSNTVPVQQLGGSVRAATGGGTFGLYLMDNGTVRGCGADGSGELGDGGTVQGGYRNLPVNVGSLTNIVQVAANGDDGYALDSTGHVYAWGSTNFGQVGDGSTQFTNSEGAVVFPKQVSALSGIVQIAAGGLFAMALDSNGHVWTWGDNHTGELGRTTVPIDDSGADPNPAQIALNHVTRIAASNYDGDGHDAGYAVSGGNVYSWGDNTYGQLGTGNTTSRTTPGQVVTSLFGSASSDHAVSVASGLYSTFVRGSAGDVFGFGSDINSSLGNGATGDSFLPMAISGLSNVTQIVASPDAGRALLANGTYAEWGTAIPFSVQKTSPVVQPAPVAVTFVAATGGDTMLAIAKDPTSVAVTPTHPSVAKGRTTQMTATASYADSTQADATGMATWSSDDAGVAPVSATGLVTAATVGTTNIHATVDGVSGATPVDVTPPVPDHLVLSPAEYTLPVGESATLKVSEVLSDNSTLVPASVGWASSNSSAVTVNASSGLFHAVGIGTSTITATADGVQGTSLLHVAHVTGLSIAPPGGTILVGENKVLYSTATFDNSTSGIVLIAAWTSSTPTTASVSNIKGGGVVVGKAVSATPVTITAALEGHSGTTTVHVASVSSVTVAPSSSHLAPGTQKQLSATAHLSDGTTRNVASTATWSSTAPARASVSATGLVTAGTSVGTATIRATFKGVVGTATVATSHVSTITVSPASFSLVGFGATKQLTATGHLVDGSTQVLTTIASWSSDDPESVDVSESGLVTNESFGNNTVIIRADYDGQEGTATAHTFGGGGD